MSSFLNLLIAITVLNYVSAGLKPKILLFIAITVLNYVSAGLKPKILLFKVISCGPKPVLCCFTVFKPP